MLGAKPLYVPQPTEPVVSEDIARITVCSEEVPLDLYWQAVDLYSTGKNIDLIVDEIHDAHTDISGEQLHGIVSAIAHNQDLINFAPASALLEVNSVPTTAQNTRRNSRIQDVNELDDLHVAHLVAAKKEKDRAGLRHLLSKLT